MELNLNIEGSTQRDLIESLEEALKRVRAGNIEGFDSRPTARFNFRIEGSPVENFAIALNGDDSTLTEERYDSYAEAEENLRKGTKDVIVGLREDGEVLATFHNSRR